MRTDAGRGRDGGLLGAALVAHESGLWLCHARLEKRDGHGWGGTWADIVAGLAPDPYEILERDGNILVTNGVLQIWKALTGGSYTAFNNANARLGVGDSTTAVAAGDTDLNAATNKLRKAMDATFPLVGTAGGLSADNQVKFQSTFVAADANWAWQEWGVFNAASGATSMLNHKQESWGTKVSPAVWTFSATLSIT